MRTGRLVGFLGLIIFLISCRGEITPPVEGPVDFERDIQPIFNQSCALSGCHKGPNPTGNLRLEEGYSYENLVNVVSFGYSPALRVKPGSPEESVLYHKVSYSGLYGGGMPPTGPLPPEKVDLIRRWIEELAPGDSALPSLKPVAGCWF